MIVKNQNIKIFIRGKGGGIVAGSDPIKKKCEFGSASLVLMTC